VKTKLDMVTPNIILITVDSLRRDHLGCYGYSRNTTPRIDVLASKGIRFLEAISSGGQTPQAFPAILASALPPLEKVQSSVMLRQDLVLAELLKQAGYYTAAFHINPYLSCFYGYNRGFDFFDDGFSQSDPKGWWLWARRLADTQAGLMGKMINRALPMIRPFFLRVLLWHPLIDAEEINRRALSWVENCEGNFFLWLHYMDVHHPYMPSDSYLSQFSDQHISRRKKMALHDKMLKNPQQLSRFEIETIVNLYDASIRYVDESIGMLLDSIEEHLPNTLVVITADHGDEFREHGKFSHESVYDEILRVPLVMVGPGIKGGMVVRQQVGLIDLAPTIVEFAGIGRVPSFRGRSLLPLIEGSEANSEGLVSTYVHPEGWAMVAYRVPDWKYMRTERLDGTLLSEAIYDLNNDPSEASNLYGGNNEAANRFKLEAEQKIAQFKQIKVGQATAYEKQRIKAKLKKVSRP
jgi:arylsulfatase A-like enzyme